MERIRLTLNFLNSKAFLTPLRKNHIKKSSKYSSRTKWSPPPGQSAKKLKWYHRKILCASLAIELIFPDPSIPLVTALDCIVHFISLLFNYNRISLRSFCTEACAMYGLRNRLVCRMICLVVVISSSLSLFLADSCCSSGFCNIQTRSCTQLYRFPMYCTYVFRVWFASSALSHMLSDFLPCNSIMYSIRMNLEFCGIGMKKRGIEHRIEMLYSRFVLMAHTNTCTYTYMYFSWRQYE